MFVIRQLGKLVHKENCSHDFVSFLNYSIIIIQVTYIKIETKEVSEGLKSVIVVSIYDQYILVNSLSSQ